MGFKLSGSGLVLRLSMAQLISWGSIFYMSSVLASGCWPSRVEPRLTERNTAVAQA
jgi:hypothetical protein